MSEVKELENRRRYRRYLQRNENPTSEETVKRKATPNSEFPEPRGALTVSRNRESSLPNTTYAEPVLPSLVQPNSSGHHAGYAGEDELALVGQQQHGPDHTASDAQPITSPDTPSSGRYLSMRPRRRRLFPSPSNSTGPHTCVADKTSLRLEEPEEENTSATSPRQALTGSRTEEPVQIMTHGLETADIPRSGEHLPSLSPPYSQSPRRASGGSSFTLVRSKLSWNPLVVAERLTELQPIHARPSLAGEAAPSTLEHRRRQSSSCHSPDDTQHDEEPGTSPPSSPRRASRGAGRFLQLCPVLGHRSPSSSHDSPPPRESPLPSRATPGRPTSLARTFAIPGRRVRVYDDLASPTRQPQTPEQLPEARHQSRLSASYTAPVSRFRSAQTPGRTPVTARRIHQRRGPSPLGMRTSGFEGLYGGWENNDDVTLFDEASQAREPGSPD